MLNPAFKRQVESGAFLIADCCWLRSAAKNLVSHCKLNEEYQELSDEKIGMYFLGTSVLTKNNDRIIITGHGMLQWKIGSGIAFYQAGCMIVLCLLRRLRILIPYRIGQAMVNFSFGSLVKASGLSVSTLNYCQKRWCSQSNKEISSSISL